MTRKIINGRIYDTRTADAIADRFFAHPQGSDYPEDVDTLYRTPRGGYFINSESLSEYEGKTVFALLTISQAIDWLDGLDASRIDFAIAKELQKHMELAE